MRVAVVLFVLAACQSGKDPAKEPASAPAAGVSPAYRQDITNLCDAVKLSGADQQPEEARQMMVARWLGPNITTQEARDFLVHIQPMGVGPKAEALELEAKRVGLADCALAALWKK